MFRHGAAQDAYNEEGGDLDRVILRTGHLSKMAAREYARSDAERSSLCAKYKKMDQKAKNEYADKRAKEALAKSKEAFKVRSTSAYKNAVPAPPTTVPTSKYRGFAATQTLIQTEKQKIDRKIESHKKAKSEYENGLGALAGKKGNMHVVIQEGLVRVPRARGGGPRESAKTLRRLTSVDLFRAQQQQKKSAYMKMKARADAFRSNGSSKG